MSETIAELVEDWATEAELSYLGRPDPLCDIEAICSAIFWISLLRRRRAPESLEKVLLLCGGEWCGNYFEQLVERDEPSMIVGVLDGRIVIQRDPRHWEEVDPR